MQAIVLSKLQKVTKNFGLDFVKETNASNVGSIYVGDITTGWKLRINYDFQFDYCSMHFYSCDDGFKKAIKDYHYLLYTESERIQELLQWYPKELSRFAVAVVDEEEGATNDKKRKNVIQDGTEGDEPSLADQVRELKDLVKRLTKRVKRLEQRADTDDDE